MLKYARAVLPIQWLGAWADRAIAKIDQSEASPLNFDFQT